MATFGLIMYTNTSGARYNDKYLPVLGQAMVQYFGDNQALYNREVAFVDRRDFNKTAWPEMLTLRIGTDPTLIIYRIVGDKVYAAGKLVGSQINVRNIVGMMREIARLRIAPDGDVLYNPETDPLLRIGARKDMAPGGGLIAAPNLLGPESNLDFDGGLLQKLLGYAALGLLGFMILNENKK